jgi:hypothetical protein
MSLHFISTTYKGTNLRWKIRSRPYRHTDQTVEVHLFSPPPACAARLRKKRPASHDPEFQISPSSSSTRPLLCYLSTRRRLIGDAASYMRLCCSMQRRLSHAFAAALLRQEPPWWPMRSHLDRDEMEREPLPTRWPPWVPLVSLWTLGYCRRATTVYLPRPASLSDSSWPPRSPPVQSLGTAVVTRVKGGWQSIQGERQQEIC